MSEADGFDIDPHAFLAPTDEATSTAGDDRASGGSSAEAVASLEHIEQELGEVEHALSRLDEGQYGVCEACGAEIGDAWLADHPTERRCSAHRMTPSRPSASTGTR